jgi:hypothetical protein
MAKLDMLTPQNCAIALIDYQPAMYQGVIVERLPDAALDPAILSEQ